MTKQTNGEKVLIRFLKDMKDYQLTTGELYFVLSNLQRIYQENLTKDTILKFFANSGTKKTPNPMLLKTEAINCNG